MPNHVTNVLQVTGEDAKVSALFEAIKHDEVGIGSIDFNKIIPIPDTIYQGDLGPAEREKYGKNNWYDWSVSNWGSKWNGYGYEEFQGQDIEENCLKFLTAWNNVDRVISQLAQMHPDLSFEYAWADEDFGFNTGQKSYAKGQEIASYIPIGGSVEAIELAAQVQDIDLGEIGYLYNEETNAYEYHDPEEQIGFGLK